MPKKKFLVAALSPFLLLACSSTYNATDFIEQQKESMSPKEAKCIDEIIDGLDDLVFASEENAVSLLDQWKRQCKQRVIFMGHEDERHVLPIYVIMCIESQSTDANLSIVTFQDLERECRQQCFDDPYQEEIYLGGKVTNVPVDELVRQNCKNRVPTTTTTISNIPSTEKQDLVSDSDCELPGECDYPNNSGGYEPYDDSWDESTDPCEGYNLCVIEPDGDEYGRDWINDPYDDPYDGR